MALAKSKWTADGGSSAVATDRRSDAGFSLLEVLTATTIMAVGLTALAQLFVVSTKSNHSAKATTYAAVLAQQKMEQLRSLTWGFDNLGLPISDTQTNITVVPEQAGGGVGLSPSPVGTLSSDTAGYCDYIDKNGQALGAGMGNPPSAPNGTVYIRRWSVEPLPTNPNNTLVLQVLVTRWRDRGRADTATGVTRLPDEARIISVKTRKAT
jgi:prepilin-type N-terminal cleavage/methylation domain-containing protein